MRALIVCITLLFALLTCTMAQIPSVKVEDTKGGHKLTLHPWLITKRL